MGKGEWGMSFLKYIDVEMSKLHVDGTNVLTNSNPKPNPNC